MPPSKRTTTILGSPVAYVQCQECHQLKLDFSGDCSCRVKEEGVVKKVVAWFKVSDKAAKT